VSNTGEKKVLAYGPEGCAATSTRIALITWYSAASGISVASMKFAAVLIKCAFKGSRECCVSRQRPAGQAVVFDFIEGQRAGGRLRRFHR
jgi:hypothetical protein